MQKRIEVINAVVQENTLELHTNDSLIDLNQIRASGQMLVDSDRLSFIYILENDHEFIYVGIPSSTWSDLRKVMTNNIPTILMLGKTSIELTGVSEELNYLISNIEGNSNYGEEMVSKVEEIFVKS
jgi:hypothetical protein